MANSEVPVGLGWELQSGICDMGHFALTKELFPILQSSEDACAVSLLDGV